jgi:hypothetical protein
MARSGLHYRPVRLRKWFPPQDPLANAVARLCVLREDLLLEFFGIANERIDRLDDNGDFYRRTYFWRNSFRTMEETRKVLSRLNAQGEFRDALLQEPESVRNAFEELNALLIQTSREFLARLRNAVGGHLDEKEFQLALDNMDPLEGLVVVGERLGQIHYKFATDLLWSVLLQGVPEKQRSTKALELLQRTGSLTQLVSAMDNAIAIYIERRRPHRR